VSSGSNEEMMDWGASLEGDGLPRWHQAAVMQITQRS
jgi:hypothetical protein